jgi:hypothetical protein
MQCCGYRVNPSTEEDAQPLPLSKSLFCRHRQQYLVPSSGTDYPLETGMSKGKAMGDIRKLVIASNWKSFKVPFNT